VAPALAGLGEGLGFIAHYRKASDVFAVGDSFTIADAALIPLFFFFDSFAKASAPTSWWRASPGSPPGGRAKASPILAAAASPNRRPA
jgi:glutathione S-transferase